MTKKVVKKLSKKSKAKLTLWGKLDNWLSILFAWIKKVCGMIFHNELKKFW